ncbi:hypothetical protein IV203_032004 [Nitzschia inconspicua]|uniref:Uncharacterized protein n=1 Tax=Nitzschia inconspicua TaxID=303405 RepID=A0A9K3LY74_9STRA|nr:hypothetical protein IV203_032004 [Nitzschia inconspicua]
MASSSSSLLSAPKQIASIMSRWIQSFARTGWDSVALSRALWMAHRNSTTLTRSGMKPVLLDQARQSNRVATSLLYMEKEYGLLKYFGLKGYLQQRIQARLSSSSNKASESSPAISSNNNKIGDDPSKKIAFMITSSMKQQLQDSLGYSTERIKTMTPVQASLALNHQLEPEKYDEQITILEKEYEKEQEQLRQQEQERLQEEQERQAREQLQLTSSQPPPDYVFEDRSSSINPEELASAIGVESGFGETWFEVVEVKPNGEVVRQGLYPNMAEADLGLETRELIRDRQMEKDEHRFGAANEKLYSAFEIRQVSRSEIMEQQYQ